MTVAANTVAARWRGVRGGIVGLLAWSSVLTAHVAASGALPSIGATVATVGLAALVGISFAGRQFTWWRGFFVLLLLQPLLHVSLAALGGGHHHSVSDSSASWVMVGAHVVAAAVAACWVTVGDRLLVAVVHALGSPWHTLAARPAQLSMDLPRRWFPRPNDAPYGPVLTGALNRRGPPRVCGV